MLGLTWICLDEREGMLLVTNIVIYASQPGGDWLSFWTANPEAAVASVSRIEALGFKSISAEEEAVIRVFLEGCPVYPLDDDVIERAIKLRQRRRMKLGGAIIAATALEYSSPLVTRNVEDFKHLTDLTVINPFDSELAPRPGLKDT